MDQQITATINQPTLEELREKLVKWRKIKRYHREPVPKDIWKDATELAKKYSIYKVSKALSLNYVNLKTRVMGPSKKKPENKKTPFIELGQLPPAAEIVLEMENKKGSRLKVCLKGKIDFDPMDIARTFLQKNL
jgi:hypothetical protein